MAIKILDGNKNCSTHRQTIGQNFLNTILSVLLGVKNRDIYSPTINKRINPQDLPKYFGVQEKSWTFSLKTRCPPTKNVNKLLCTK